MLGIVWFSEKKYKINISRNKRNYPNYLKLRMKTVCWLGKGLDEFRICFYLTVPGCAHQLVQHGPHLVRCRHLEISAPGSENKKKL